MEEATGGCLEMEHEGVGTNCRQRNGPDSWDREMPERTGHNPDTGENISQVMREDAKGLDTKAR